MDICEDGRYVYMKQNKTVGGGGANEHVHMRRK